MLLLTGNSGKVPPTRRGPTRALYEHFRLRLKEETRLPPASDSAVETFLLAAFGCLLFASNSYITFIDDETTILADAVAPVRQTLTTLWTGAGQHEHPPLYDLLLYFWLRITGGAFDWLRLPSIVFYLIGLWMLSLAAGHLGGGRGARSVLWLGVLWPYGFHYGQSLEGV